MNDDNSFTRFSNIFLLMFYFLSSAAAAANQGGTVKDFGGTSYHYPPARTEAVIDTLHGKAIADPYRWMENLDDPGVRSWIDAENALTQRILDGIPGRSAFVKRLSEILSIGTIGVPEVAGNRYFYEKRQGNENQPVLYWREGPDGEQKVLLDPNVLSVEGIVAIDWWYPSRDGHLLAYGLSERGSEQSTLHVLDVDTRRKFEDTIARTRASSVAWLPDGSGFYYMRFPNAGEVPKGEEHFHSRIRFHRLGADPATDPVIFGEGLDMQDWLSCDLSDDGRFLVVHASTTGRRTSLFLRNLSDTNGAFIEVSEGKNSHFLGDVHDGVLYIRTDYGAPNYRLFKVSAASPSHADWKEIIPEGKFKLEQAAFAGGRIFALYLEDASSRLCEYDTDGKLRREIGLPGIGTVYGVGGQWRGSEFFFGFTSFFVPQTVLRVDIGTDRVDIYDRVVSPVDVSRYTAEQVWCRSKDGTSVPMFVVRGKNAVLDGGNPTILYGYGGFDIPITPSFSNTIIPWLEAGGIYVVANLRGGGEFGEEWHRAGMFEKKQNVFDDYIAAAEWLFAEKYTSPARLALFGGSNGGLLVGAVVTQRPDLCAAAVCAVPVLDMMRYHLFSVGRYWISEFGDPRKAEEFAYLIKYSPYHNVKDGARYPAILLTTADSDSRVDPAHAMKMTARLQAATVSENPVLLRFETKAGHGFGAPVQKMIDEYADYLAFFSWRLGMERK